MNDNKENTKWIKENTWQILGVLAVLLNLFLATKLYPIQQSLAVIIDKVEAQEITDRGFVPRNEIEARLDSIIIQLDRIEDKLGR